MMPFAGKYVERWTLILLTDCKLVSTLVILSSIKIIHTKKNKIK